MLKSYPSLSAVKILVVFFLAVFLQCPVSAYKWESCIGVTGVCINVSLYSCSTPTLTGRCPGPQNIRCCQAPGGVTDSRCTAIANGVCTRTEHCPRSTVSGKCPGPSEVTCCPANIPPKRSSPPSSATWTQCTSVRGVCIDTNVYDCSGATRTGLCGGGSNIRCCPMPYGVLDARCRALRDGVCTRTENCPSSTVPKKCPGPSRVTCCPRNKPTKSPSSVPALWTACSGVPGVCTDSTKYPCSGPTLTNRCGGGANIRCCPYPFGVVNDLCRTRNKGVCTRAEHCQSSSLRGICPSLTLACCSIAPSNFNCGTRGVRVRVRSKSDFGVLVQNSVVNPDAAGFTVLVKRGNIRGPDGRRTRYFNIAPCPGDGLIVFDFFIHSAKSTILVGDDRDFNLDPLSGFLEKSRMLVVLDREQGRGILTISDSFACVPVPGILRRVLKRILPLRLPATECEYSLRGDELCLTCEARQINFLNPWPRFRLSKSDKNSFRFDATKARIRVDYDAINSVTAFTRVISVDGPIVLDRKADGKFQTGAGHSPDEYPSIYIVQYLPNGMRREIFKQDEKNVFIGGPPIDDLRKFIVKSICDTIPYCPV